MITDANTVNITKILDFLPHRYPFLLIDRVIDHNSCSLVAIKNVSINEPFFQGHFPKTPVMPGVLLIEAMAQAAGLFLILSSEKHEKGRIHYLSAVDGARFKRPVTPGDTLRITVSLVRRRAGFVQCAAECTVADQKVASALLMIRPD